MNLARNISRQVARQIARNLAASGGSAEPATPAAPAFSTQVTITGTPTVGETLTGVVGTVTGSPTPSLAYAWLADDVVISGATSITYSPVVGDVGAVIKFRATATNSEGSAVSTSVETAAVEAEEVLAAPIITAQPANQTTALGQDATFSITATGNPTPTYQWQELI